MENQTVEAGKTNAIISHFWIIGIIIALVLNNKDKNSYTSFYIRQMIGLNLLSLLNGWIIGQYVNRLASTIIAVILLVLWIISFVSVLKGEKKAVPVVGEHFQDWFKNF